MEVKSVKSIAAKDEGETFIFQWLVELDEKLLSSDLMRAGGRQAASHFVLVTSSRSKYGERLGGAPMHRSIIALCNSEGDMDDDGFFMVWMNTQYSTKDLEVILFNGMGVIYSNGSV